ncbi:hypothetical protein [Pseudomonas fluorescens]|uniref:Uncharacterized protein n=1 Tax=Pseudomonas fluorescens TaxID=294 RepID=A0A0F4SSU3_PSEFL|nr:hypothetical protein [Pseudomonas fluorescens]KJZ34830.1 hypothetical protein VC34_28115 [Pseudomonas fluorescens]
MSLYIPTSKNLSAFSAFSAFDTSASAALAPLRVGGMIENVVDADFALGIDQLRNGALCAIDHYLNMAAGDTVELFFTSQDRADAYKFIRKEDVDNPDGRILFTIPRSNFISRTYENVHYRVTRLSGSTEDSPPQKVLVLLTRPGGVDKNSDPISHSELHQTLEPDVAERGIDAERAKAGTWVTIEPYPFLRVRDKIELKWGTAVLRHVVTKEQAEAPKSNPIKIFVSRTVIENAGSSNKLPVMFKPIDEANNLPDENGPWSTPSYVDVDLDDSKLVEPFVEKADYTTGEIDLKALNGADVKVEVQTNRQNYTPGSRISLTWAGETVDGTPISQRFEITVDAPGRTYEAFVSYENVKAIPFSKATVSYEVQTDKGRLYSKNTFVRVVGQLNALLAPTIDKANGNYLPPNLSKATATIPYYAGRSANDMVILFIAAGLPGGGTELYEDARLVGDLPPGLPITRDIQEADLKRFDGLSITVLYEVHTASVRTSDVLKLTVGEPRKDLPAPILEGATPEGVFDPVPDREVIYQIPLILTITKDKGTWYFQGVNQAASTQGTFELTTGSSARPIRIPLARHYVDLNQGHTVRMFYNLTRNGTVIYSDFREVRIGTPLPTLLEPIVVEAPGRILDPNRYQDGFTARVITSTFEPNDAIELTVHGRPGDGSTTPERKMVNGQASVDFNIPAAITGANLKTVVNISYKVIRLGQETPSKTLELSIGELLQQSMPRPLIEGFVGELLEIGSIKDNTRVLSDKWPFQRSGLPIWLSYVESRTDGTTRSRDQFVGTPHDQGAGLSYTTEVQWLRECKADSKLEIVLKVGLFKEATVSDAVECQARVYTVKTGLDKLTTFDRFNWDGWVPHPTQPSQIVLEQGEYFVQSNNYSNYLIFNKSYDDIETGEVYELSFKYQCRIASLLHINRDGVTIHSATIPASNTWRTHSITFPSKNTSPASPMLLYFQLGLAAGYPVGSSKIDEIRLRYVP